MSPIPRIPVWLDCDPGISSKSGPGISFVRDYLWTYG